MAISIDPVFLVTNECVAVAAAMRKNARWAQSGVASILSTPVDTEQFSLASGMGLRGREGGDHPLIDGFSRLRSDLNDIEDFSSYSAEALLRPFLEVVRSQATTGTITLLSLNAIGKFLTLGVVNAQSVELSVALQELAQAITHCRFQATDQNEDDAVLLKILSLMEEVACSAQYAPLLSDESICEIVETCLSMACQMRRGDVLRRAAEMTMIKLSHSVFSQLQYMEPEDESIGLEEEGEVQMKSPQTDAAATGIEDMGSTIRVENTQQEDQTGEEKDQTTTRASEPYGIASIREVLQVLVSILDPVNQHQYTDSTRIMALRLINVAFEVSGTSVVRHRSLLNLTTRKLCKHLLQLVRNDNPALLQSALIVFSTVLQTCKKHLKLQQEYFFTYLLTTLTPLMDIPREPDVDKIFYDGVPNAPKLVKMVVHPVRTQAGTPVGGVTAASLTRSATPVIGPVLKGPEAREIMVEAISNLSRTPSFFTDLFVNYDCDVDRTDLCEDLVGFLCRSAYPDSAQWSTQSVPPLCLEAILSLVHGLAASLSRPEPDEATLANVNSMIEKKRQKKQAIAAAEAFNDKPKAGLAMVVDKGIIPDNTPESIASWLKSSGRINKKVLGEYLSKTSNSEVLGKFIESFNFSGMRLDEALREFLSTFRLPGESALIEKIFSKFSEQYYQGEGNQEDVADADATFVLSYAVIMLNTDQHNSQNKRKMTLEGFKRNLEGTNSNKNFREEYLEEIYRTIKSREIIMPDEHDNDESFEFAWKSILLRTAQAGEIEQVGPRTNAYDRHVFQSAWKPITTTLSFIFATASDDTVLSRVIMGFDQVARLAAHYHVDGAIDHIVECLSRMSTLGAGDQSAPTTNTRIEVEGTGGSLTVSDLSVPFGSDSKAQMASVILFRIVTAHAKNVNQAWDYILPALANLYLYNLINSPFSQELEQYGVLPLNPVEPHMTVRMNKGGRDVGFFFNALYSLVKSEQAAEPTDEELDSTKSTIECIKQCGLQEFFHTVRNLDANALSTVVSWIVARLPKLVDQKQAYYPVTLFYLDMATVLCYKDEDAVIKVWSTLNTYLKNWQAFGDTFLWRIAVYSIVVVIHAGSETSDKDALEHELATTLSNILGINASILKSGSQQLVGPLIKLLDSWCRSIVINSDDYWTLISIVSETHPSEVYAAIKLVDAAEVTSQNFGPILRALSSVSACEDSKQGLQVVHSVTALGSTIDRNDHDWQQRWLDYTGVLANLCSSPSRAVRDEAFKHLQRILLDPSSENSAQDWPKTFDKVMFPLIEYLLKPEVFRLDPEGMAVTRLHVASLICRVFLQYVVQVQSHNDSVLKLWTKILDTLDRLVNSGRRENSLRESVVESLKNILLVAGSSDFGADEQFWQVTWQRIDKFLPGLRQQIELEPEAPKDAEPEKPKQAEPEEPKQVEPEEPKDPEAKEAEETK